MRRRALFGRAITSALLLLLTSCSLGPMEPAQSLSPEVVSSLDRIEKKVESGTATDAQKETAALIKALSERVAQQDREIAEAKAEALNKGTNPTNWTPTGALAVLGAIATLVMKQRERNETERRLRKAISDFDALPDNVVVEPDGSLKPL